MVTAQSERATQEATTDGNYRHFLAREGIKQSPGVAGFVFLSLM